MVHYHQHLLHHLERYFIEIVHHLGNGEISDARHTARRRTLAGRGAENRRNTRLAICRTWLVKLP